MREALVAFVKHVVRWILAFVLIIVAVIGISLLATMDHGPRNVASEVRNLGLISAGLAVLGAAWWARSWAERARRTGQLDALVERWRADPSWRVRVYVWSLIIVFDAVAIGVYGRVIWFPAVMVLGAFVMPVAFAVMMCALGWVFVMIVSFCIGFFSLEVWAPRLDDFVSPPISFTATYLVPVGVRIGLPVGAVLVAITGAWLAVADGWLFMQRLTGS